MTLRATWVLVLILLNGNGPGDHKKIETPQPDRATCEQKRDQGNAEIKKILTASAKYECVDKDAQP